MGEARAPPSPAPPWLRYWLYAISCGSILTLASRGSAIFLGPFLELVDALLFSMLRGTPTKTSKMQEQAVIFSRNCIPVLMLAYIAAKIAFHSRKK